MCAVGVVETDRGEPIVRVMVCVLLVWGLTACGPPVDGRAVPVPAGAGVPGCALLGDTPVVPEAGPRFAYGLGVERSM